MPTIRLRQFDGISPRSNPSNLGDFQAESSVNVNLLSTTIEPFKGSTLIEAIDGGKESLFLYHDDKSDAKKFLVFDGDVDVVRGPIVNDSFNRIYYTGEGTPKVRGGTFPGTEHDLGAPAPTPAPVATAQDITSTSFTRNWKYFYEETDGERRDAGTLTEPGDIVENVVGQQYTLAVIPPKVTASASAVFVMYFETDDLLVLYPDVSKSSGSSNLTVDNAVLSASLVTGATAVLNITYNTGQINNITGSTTYIYTFVTGFGEESAPSDASNVVDVSPVEDVNLTGMATAQPSGNYNVTNKRIYRAATSDSGTVFRFVAEIPLGDSSYLDTLQDGDLGEEIPSLNYDQPPDDLKGLVSLPNGFLAGFKGKNLHLSEPYQPHAWPADYIISVDSEIVGLGVSGNSVAIMTDERPYISTGFSPDTMTLTQLHINQSCVSKKSIVNIGNTVLYASPDGLVAVQDGSATVISYLYFTKENWQLFSPETMVGAYHDEQIWFFNGAGNALIYNLDDQRSHVSTVEETAAGAYTDLEDDTLYVIQGTEIRSLNTGSAKEAMWQSKEFTEKVPLDWGCGRIIADGYPMTLKIYRDSVLVSTSEVADDEIFWLKPLESGKKWSIEVSGFFGVQEIAVSTSKSELSI